MGRLTFDPGRREYPWYWVHNPWYWVHKGNSGEVETGVCSPFYSSPYFFCQQQSLAFSSTTLVHFTSRSAGASTLAIALLLTLAIGSVRWLDTVKLKDCFEKLVSGWLECAWKHCCPPLHENSETAAVTPWEQLRKRSQQNRMPSWTLREAIA